MISRKESEETYAYMFWSPIHAGVTQPHLQSRTVESNGWDEMPNKILFRFCFRLINTVVFNQ